MSDAHDKPPIPDSQPRPVPPVEGLAPGDVSAWLHWGTRVLAEFSDSARADAEELMAAQIGVPRAQLSMRGEDAFRAADALRYAGAVERRRVGEPVAVVASAPQFTPSGVVLTATGGGEGVTYAWTPASSLSASQFLVNGTLYLPGVMRNHNLVINVAHQQKGDQSAVNFSNNFPFSRGYTAENLQQLNKIGINYITFYKSIIRCIFNIFNIL